MTTRTHPNLKDRKKQTIRVHDFSGGLNVFDHPYSIANNEIAEIRNVELSRVQPRTRYGNIAYIQKAFKNLTGGIRGGHRYRTSAGTKKIVVNSNGSIEGDNDAGQFAQLGTMTQAGDNFIRFAQYRDTLFAVSELADIAAYNSAATTPFQANIENSFPFVSTSVVGTLDASFATTGGELLDDNTYLWRVTFDLEHGGTFLGETAASGLVNSTQRLFDLVVHDFSGGTNVNLMNLKRPSNAVVDAIPEYVARVNLYRSEPLLTATYLSSLRENAKYEDTELFFVGSVDMATVRAATAGDVIFTDDGTVPPGKQIPFGVMVYSPRPRFSAIHKGRQWAAYCNIAENVTSPTYTLRQDRIYYSRLFANGPEPVIFTTAGWFQLDHYTGEGITGIASWRGKHLLAFKPNKTFVIVGGDDLLTANDPNISIETLSEDVGCIAPQTIVHADGAVVWVSTRGPYYFDGSGPHPLMAEKVRPLLDLVPESRRRYMTATYHPSRREYVIFFSLSEYTSGNTYSLRYSFISKNWTMEKHTRGIGTVINVADTDTAVKVLYGFDDLAIWFDGTAADDPIIVRAHTGFRDVNVPIDWRIVTKYFDFGSPTVEKVVERVAIEGDWRDPISIDFRVDSRIDTELNGGTLVFQPPTNQGVGITGKHGIAILPVPGRVVSGKRIQMILRGQNDFGNTHLTNVFLTVSEEGEGLQTQQT